VDRPAVVMRDCWSPVAVPQGSPADQYHQATHSTASLSSSSPLSEQQQQLRLIKHSMMPQC